MRALALAAAAALVAGPVAAQAYDPPAPAFRPAVAPDTVTVGERFVSALAVALPPGTAVEAAVETDTAADVTALGPAAVRPPADPAGEHRIEVTMAAWRPGASPALTARVLLRYDGGPTVSVDVPLALPHVRSVLPANPDSLRPRPAKDVVGPSAPPAWVRWAIVGALALAMLAAGAWLLRRLARRRPQPAAAPTDARARALAALRALEASGLAERDARGAFHARLSGTLRAFAAEVSPAWSRDRTTAELLSAMRDDGAAADEVAPLAAVLERADLAKFARRGFPPDASRADLAAARAWVERFPAARLAPVAAAGSDAHEMAGAGADGEGAR